MVVERELTQIEFASSVRFARYYQSVGREADQQEYDVVLLHGWLGAETMDLYCAPYLAEHGFNTSTVVANAPHAWNFNEQASLDAHAAAKAHVVKAQQKGAPEQGRPIIVVDHSRGNIAGISLVEYSLDPRVTYSIAAIISMAGVGLNGHPVGPKQVLSQIQQSAALARYKFPEFSDVLQISLGNLLKNPPLAALKGLHAGRAKLDGKAFRLRERGLYMPEWYGEDDGLILKPKNRSDFYTYDGGHMLPIVEPELVLMALYETIRMLNVRKQNAV